MRSKILRALVSASHLGLVAGREANLKIADGGSSQLSNHRQPVDAIVRRRVMESLERAGVDEVGQRHP
jgi:hypothetical protein